MKTVYYFAFIFFISVNAFAQDALVYREDISKLSDQNNDFAFEFFHYLNQKNDQNLFFSPFSIRSAMATLYVGSVGSTAAEMAKVFHFNEDKAGLTSSYRQLLAHYHKLESEQLHLKMLNNLWVQKEFTFENSYMNQVTQSFKASVRYLDFRAAHEKSRATINQEIDKQSEHFITELLGPGIVTDRTRLLSTNLIFLDALWKMPFNPKQNQKGAFYASDQEIQGVEYMTAENILVNYYETKAYQLLEMPYQGDKLGMLIILPKNKSGIDQLPLNTTFYKEKTTISKKQEDAIMFDEIDHKKVFFPSKVDITFPKFKFKTNLNLKDMLIEMGLENAFSEAADFSAITGSKNLFLGEALHQTYVDVNETGTKAIAATAVSSVEKGMHEPIIFKADHPFVFMIRDHTNGCILFMGKVTNPLLSN